jgi:hypothetical protein
MIIYQNPIPIIGRNVRAVASYTSRKHRDTILVLHDGAARYLHVKAGCNTCVGATGTIRRA